MWALQALASRPISTVDGTMRSAYANKSLNLAETMAFRFAALSAKVLLASGTHTSRRLDEAIELAHEGDPR